MSPGESWKARGTIRLTIRVCLPRSPPDSILYAKELTLRRLIPPPVSSHILALSVHPGAVATDQEKAAQEPYGILGTALVAASRVFFMSPEQGAESALWASTSIKLEGGDEKAVQKYQGAYLTQPDDSVSSGGGLWRSIWLNRGHG